jgi:2-amino-4-hydroxy-6-hydroxymethyldihydropteridine diphosphokinase
MLNRMADAYVGLGANLGDPRAQLEAAIVALATSPGVIVRAISSAYESDPVGPVSDQPPFLNAVARVETTLTPVALLRVLLGIEDTLGRTRAVRFGPRTCDLDLLLYDDAVLDEPDLVLPHPRLAERRFVLEPLAELAPGLVLPDGRRVADLLAAVADQGVRRLDGPPLGDPARLARLP